MATKKIEGLQFTKLIMVLSSMAPLFILWAVRGTSLITDKYFIPICIGFIVIPTGILYWRIHIAKKNNDLQVKKTNHVDDSKDHILIYLFAIMLPLYTANLQVEREVIATLLALMFIIFLFWHLDMHYMNLVFALFGYRVYTINPNKDDQLGSQEPFVLLSKRIYLMDGQSIDAYRLSNTVYIEKEK